MTTHRHAPWSGLLARFDNALLHPPEGDAAAAAGALAVPPGAQLLDWCHGAHIVDAAGLEGPGADVLAQALALHLDGSDRLAACTGAVARLTLRLRVKADDLAMAWRAPRRSDCWDCGWLADEPAALARLAHWQPRRATLVLVGEVAGSAAPGDPAGADTNADLDARWHAAGHLLAARATTLARRVRLLRVAVTPASSGQSLRLMHARQAAVMPDKSVSDTA